MNLVAINRVGRGQVGRGSRLRSCSPLLRRASRGAIVPRPRNDGGRPSRVAQGGATNCFSHAPSNRLRSPPAAPLQKRFQSTVAQITIALNISDMRVTIFGPYAAWSPHFETDLELAELHLRKRDTVSFITCDAVLKCCEPNYYHDYATCLRCMGIAKAGLSLLPKRIRIVPLSSLILPISDELQIVNSICARPLSYDALYDITIDNFDLGAAALSTMNDLFRDPEPNPADNLQITREVLFSALATYKALCKYLKENPCDMFYVFNGRFANLRAALRACQLRGVPCFVHERGSDLNSYVLAPNTMPHDPAFMLPYRSSTFEPVSMEVKEKVAHEFYVERSHGIIANWFSFTNQQQLGLLPDNWVQASQRLAVFTSTESEFASLRDFYPRGLYPSQKEGIIQIIKDFANRDYQGVLAVRMHPNSHDTKSDFTEELRQITCPFLIVIPPLNEIDSYSLLRTASAVLTFGSTIGIEAAYWRVPSILAAPSLYSDLGSTYNPGSHDEVIQCLLQPLQPKPIEGAINYGFFAKVYGTRFRFVVSDGVNDCTFKDRKVGPDELRRNLLYGLTNGRPGGTVLARALAEWERNRQRSLYEKVTADN